MGERQALIVGINEYGEESGLVRLRFAEADAATFAETLERVCGFETSLLRGAEATPERIARSLRRYYQEEDLELFLFYFAGHGELI